MASDSRSAAEATLLASRALLGVVARSLGPALESITLPQFRVLVVLTTTGPIRLGALAERMNTNPSTFSRSIDRMVAGGWVDRNPSPDSRREVIVELTETGRVLVEEVTDRRRRELQKILDRLGTAERDKVREALSLLADAAGESTASELLVIGI